MSFWGLAPGEEEEGSAFEAALRDLPEAMRFFLMGLDLLVLAVELSASETFTLRPELSFRALRALRTEAGVLLFERLLLGDEKLDMSSLVGT